jgi:hypothetical protein
MRKTAVILILGMHRSGTSALSGLLAQFGFDYGKNLLGPTEHNVKGFHENKRVMEFNEMLLEELGMNWADPFSVIDTTPIQNDLLNQYQQHLDSIFLEEFDGTIPIVIKDPRICLLLPFWKKYLKDFNYKGSYLHIVRHPAEVASSLKRRNNLARQHTFNLWSLYNLLAEKYTRKEHRILILYDDLMDNFDLAGGTIREFLMKSTRRKFPEILSDCIDKELRHHKNTGEDGQENEFSSTLYSLLSQARPQKQGEIIFDQLDEAYFSFLTKLTEETNFGDELSARVTVNYDDQSKEVKEFAVKGSYHGIEMDLQPGKNLESIDVNPLNQYCHIRLKTKTYPLNRKISTGLRYAWSNAMFRSGEVYCFDILYSQVKFKPLTNQVFTRVRLEIYYDRVGKNALRHQSVFLHPKSRDNL